MPDQKPTLEYGRAGPKRRPVLRFVTIASAIWALLMAADAVWFFVIPHGPAFAPEVGPLASFTIFGGIFSVAYFSAVAVIAVMVLLIRRLATFTRS